AADGGMRSRTFVASRRLSVFFYVCTILQMLSIKLKFISWKPLISVPRKMLGRKSASDPERTHEKLWRGSKIFLIVESEGGVNWGSINRIAVNAIHLGFPELFFPFPNSPSFMAYEEITSDEFVALRNVKRKPNLPDLVFLGEIDKLV